MNMRFIAAPASLFCVGVAALAMQPGAGGPGGAGGGQGQPAAGEPRRAPGGAGGQEGRGASLGSAMKAMNRSLDALQIQIADASKKTESLRLINDMQRGCIGAKGAEPRDAIAAAKTDDEKKAVARKFRESLIALARKMLDLEVNLMNDKFDAAKNDLDAIVKMHDEGHKAMGVKEDEH
jgi:hypothetical protein